MGWELRRVRAAVVTFKLSPFALPERRCDNGPDATRPNDERYGETRIEPPQALRARRRDRRRLGGLPGHDPARFRVGIAVPGPDQARGRSERGFGRHFGRGPRRNDGGDRTRARGISRQRPRVQPPSGRTQLDAQGRRRLYRTRRGDPDLRVRSRPLHQSGTLAHSLSSSRDLGLLPPVRGHARAFHPAQSQRVPAFFDRVRRQAAAHSGRQGRFLRRRLRAPGQGDPERGARRRGVDGRSRDSARGAEVPRRTRQGLPLQSGRRFGLSPRPRQGPWRRPRRRADRRRADRAA